MPECDPADRRGLRRRAPCRAAIRQTQARPRRSGSARAAHAGARRRTIMSEPEKFLDRWSRRKREAADEPAPAEARDVAEIAPNRCRPTRQKRLRFRSIPPVCRRLNRSRRNPTSAPFCKPGVPPDLARAALRRAWSADPAIRDFIGLVENGWDFNDPDGVPGFGPITAGEVARLLAQVIGAPQPGARRARRSRQTARRLPAKLLPEADSELSATVTA